MVLAAIESEVRRRARRVYCTSRAAVDTNSKEIELYVDYQEAKSRLGESELWTAERVEEAHKAWLTCLYRRLRRPLVHAGV